MPSGVTSAPPRSSLPDDDGSAPRAARQPRPPPTRTAPAPCLDAHLDRAVLDACRNAVAPSRPTNDRILYVGLNDDSAASEAAALARSPGTVRIEARASSVVTVGRASFDLSSADGPQGFATALAAAHGMTAGQARALADVLLRAPVEGRDELARIAIAWAPAEAGAAVPSRLVLSGHSTAGLLWGKHAYFSYAAVRSLAKAFPLAARQVEDVHLSGCFTEREVQGAAGWVDAFPNLKTLWGYREFCPATPTGHLADWELATRGRRSRITERFASAHASVTAWSVAGGVVAASLSLDQRRALANEADARFAGYFEGASRIARAHEPGADRDYAAYQMLAAHPQATPTERAAAVKHGAQLLRLRFYEQSVRGEFARAQGAAINAGLARLALPPADLGKLSRREAVELAEAAAGRAPPNPDATTKRALVLLAGLTELRDDVIPDRYCH